MSSTSRRYVHIALAAVPFVMMLVLTPFMNRTTPYILGLPFLLFWVVLSVVMTSVCMFVVYRTDPQNRAPVDGPEDGAA